MTVTHTTTIGFGSCVSMADTRAYPLNIARFRVSFTFLVEQYRDGCSVAATAPESLDVTAFSSTLSVPLWSLNDDVSEVTFVTTRATFRLIEVSANGLKSSLSRQCALQVLRLYL